MKRTVLSLVLVFAAPALAGDRHVYLDTDVTAGDPDGDLNLNDCPNPAHNAKGTSNTDELQYCNGGSQNKKIIGTASGRATSTACTTGGGTVQGVTLVVAAAGLDVDGDGTFEPTYGHPQACVWNMAQSDSCEIHAGTYINAGAISDNFSYANTHAGSRTNGCFGFNCWFSSVVAWGLTGSAYGTAASPAYLRGAVMNASSDTWDIDGDKIPGTVAGETAGYPAILSGDRNGNGTFQLTNCTGAFSGGAYTSGQCTGDTYSMVVVGCGGVNYSYCRNDYGANQHGVFIDTDGDGSFEFHFHDATARDPAHFIIKDLEFRGYNGGQTCTTNCDDARQGTPNEGHFLLNGNTSTDGMKVDHVYVHDNDYPPLITAQYEINWSVFADPMNDNCGANKFLEVKNSTVYQNTEKMFNADDVAVRGCNYKIHDNRFIIKTPATAPSRPIFFVFAYWKSMATSGGGQALVRRIYNNEFIIQETNADYRFTDGGGFDDNNPGPAVWFYGNIVRHDPAIHPTPDQIYGNGWLQDTCALPGGSGTGKWITFQNTYDWSNKGFGCWCRDGTANCASAACPSDGCQKLVVERNNAFLGPTRVHEQKGVTTSRAGEVCSGSFASCTTSFVTNINTTRALWFNPGAYAANDPDTWEGLTNYKARVDNGSGNVEPLWQTGSCDPDGMGWCSLALTTPCAINSDCPGGTCINYNGVDYDGDGTNDLCWKDIAGNDVCVPATGCPDPPDVGAVQSEDDISTGQVCGNSNVEAPETCDDGNTAVEACAYNDTAPYTQVCDSDCIGNVNCSAPQYCGDSVVQAGQGEECDGSVGATTCSDLGCTTGTLSCSTGPTGCRYTGCTGCGTLTCTRYVATAAGGGNNSNTGLTPGSPKLTIDAAFNTAAAGDVICVRQGTYQPACTLNCSPAYAGTYLRLFASGASGNPIIVQSYPGEQATIDGSHIAKDTAADDSNMGALVRIQGNYVTWSNIDITNSPNVSLTTYDPSGSTADGDDDAETHGNVIEDIEIQGGYGSGVELYDSHGNTVRRVKVHDNADCSVTDAARIPPGAGCTTGSCGVGNCVPPGGGSLTNGDSSDGIRTGGSSGGGHFIYDNETYMNADDGMDLYRSDNNIVFRNISHNNGRCTCGNGAGYKTGGLQHPVGGDNVLFNNMSYDNAKEGFDSYGSGGTEFYHNVAYHNGKNGWQIPCQSDATPNVLRNNISWANAQTNASARDILRTTAGTCASNCSGAPCNIDPVCTNNLFGTISTNIASGCATGRVSSAPAFVDGVSPGYNFHLTASSPAISAGYDLSTNPDTLPPGFTFSGSQLAKDFDLIVRPLLGFDIGPYEFLASPATTPSTVKGAKVSHGSVP